MNTVKTLAIDILKRGTKSALLAIGATTVLGLAIRAIESNTDIRIGVKEDA